MSQQTDNSSIVRVINGCEFRSDYKLPTTAGSVTGKFGTLPVTLYPLKSGGRIFGIEILGPFKGKDTYCELWMNDEIANKVFAPAGFEQSKENRLKW